MNGTSEPRVVSVEKMVEKLGVAYRGNNLIEASFIGENMTIGN